MSPSPPAACPNCGWKPTPHASFCRLCGADLGAAAPKPPRSARRRRVLAAIATAVFIGVVAGIAAVILINGDHSKRSTADTGPDPIQALRHHFDLLIGGHYLTASDDLTPSLLDSLGGRTSWVFDQATDPLISANLNATVPSEDGNTATVTVTSLRTESILSGCTDFTGQYGLVMAGDHWLINRADLNDHPCGGAKSQTPFLGGV